MGKNPRVAMCRIPHSTLGCPSRRSPTSSPPTPPAIDKDVMRTFTSVLDRTLATAQPDLSPPPTTNDFRSAFLSVLSRALGAVKVGMQPSI
jgi:hypothetical protein